MQNNSVWGLWQSVVQHLGFKLVRIGFGYSCKAVGPGLREALVGLQRGHEIGVTVQRGIGVRAQGVGVWEHCIHRSHSQFCCSVFAVCFSSHTPQ